MGPAARALAAQQAQRRRHLAVVTQPGDGSAEEKAHEAHKAAATQAASAATAASAEGGAAAPLAEEQPRARGAAAASGCRQQAAIMQRLYPTACLLQQLRGGAAWAGPGRLQHGRGLPAGWRKELPCPPCPPPDTSTQLPSPECDNGSCSACEDLSDSLEEEDLDAVLLREWDTPGLHGGTTHAQPPLSASPRRPHEAATPYEREIFSKVLEQASRALDKHEQGPHHERLGAGAQPWAAGWDPAPRLDLDGHAMLAAGAFCNLVTDAAWRAHLRATQRAALCPTPLPSLLVASPTDALLTLLLMHAYWDTTRDNALAFQPEPLPPAPAESNSAGHAPGVGQGAFPPVLLTNIQHVVMPVRTNVAFSNYRFTIMNEYSPQVKPPASPSRDKHVLDALRRALCEKRLGGVWLMSDDAASAQRSLLLAAKMAAEMREQGRDLVVFAAHACMGGAAERERELLGLHGGRAAQRGHGGSGGRLMAPLALAWAKAVAREVVAAVDARLARAAAAAPSHGGLALRELLLDEHEQLVLLAMLKLSTVLQVDAAKARAVHDAGHFELLLCECQPGRPDVLVGPERPERPTQALRKVVAALAKNGKT